MSNLKAHISIQGFGSKEETRELSIHINTATQWTCNVINGVVTLVLDIDELTSFAKVASNDLELTWIEYTVQFG